MSPEISQTSDTNPLIDNHHHRHPEPLTPAVLHSLRRLELFLRLLGFFHDTPLSAALSTVSFLFFAVAAPALVILVLYCSSPSPSSSCSQYHLKNFEVETLVCQVTAAATSLICVSMNLRRFGIRKFLFLDKFHGNVAQFQMDYVLEIDDFFRSLAIWVLPCLLLKTAREIAKVVLVDNDSVVRSMNYKKLLERNLEVVVYIEEHSRLTYHLSEISHRFRIFLIFEFLIVTASQFVTLLETTGNYGTIDFITAADFAISSIVQVVGITICLHASAKMSHRAQSLASFVSRWHALGTCKPNETLRSSSNVGNLNTANSAVPMGNSETESEPADYMLQPMNMESLLYMSSYYQRQAFVMYMQTNPGGITIFGWTVDRALLDTIFCIELSVVTFVLGKTLTFSTSDT